jgi:hypothetical protein
MIVVKKCVMDSHLLQLREVDVILLGEFCEKLMQHELSCLVNVEI